MCKGSTLFALQVGGLIKGRNVMPDIPVWMLGAGKRPLPAMNSKHFRTIEYSLELQDKLSGTYEAFLCSKSVSTGPWMHALYYTSELYFSAPSQHKTDRFLELFLRS